MDNNSVSVIGSISPVVKIHEKTLPTKPIEEFLQSNKIAREVCILPVLCAKDIQRPYLFVLKKNSWVKNRE